MNHNVRVNQSFFDFKRELSELDFPRNKKQKYFQNTVDMLNRTDPYPPSELYYKVMVKTGEKYLLPFDQATLMYQGAAMQMDSRARLVCVPEGKIGNGCPTLLAR